MSISVRVNPFTGRVIYCQRAPSLRKANLKGANLKGANLKGADLTRATLTRTDLTEANLTEANLTRSDLTMATLTRANLRGANLWMADIEGANLKWANLDFSCLPLWCGGQGAQIDRSLAAQFIMHALSFAVNTKDVPEYEEIRKAAEGLCADHEHRPYVSWPKGITEDD